MDQALETICRIIKENDSFLVSAHANPDGDAMGSTIALGYILTQLGKEVVLFNQSGLPERYLWMNLPGPIVREVPDPLPQWTFILDCGNLDRVGPVLLPHVNAERTINIDHHIGNPAFGEVNWLDVRKPAVGTMLVELAQKLHIPLTGGLAEAAYLAIATDTGFFTYGNTTPECLELVAELFRRGLDPGEINPKIQDVWSSNRIHLWSATMAGIRTYYEERMAIISVTRSMMRRTGTTNADCEDLVEFVRRLKEVRVAVFLREEDDDVWKFSLRSSGADNVQIVAAKFGGGGHKNASGGSIRADLDSVRRQLVVAIGQDLGLE